MRDNSIADSKIKFGTLEDMNLPQNKKAEPMDGPVSERGNF